jgi:nicotinamide-nucleotide amidase
MSKRKVRASILAIGSEVLRGAITNQNAAMVSSLLEEEGIEVVLHQVVTDEKEAIVRGLKRAEEDSELIITTGGLGPTRDDISRTSIAQWLGQPLVFSEPVWTELKAKLVERGVELQEVHRRQAFFPEGVELLRNDEGTAQGFFFQKGSHFGMALPGPRKEISSIWELGAEKKLLSAFPNVEMSKESVFWFEGIPESKLATEIEGVLDGIESQDLVLSYRLRAPRIEVRLVFPKKHEQELSAPIQEIRKKLKEKLLEFSEREIKKRYLLEF